MMDEEQRETAHCHEIAAWNEVETLIDSMDHTSTSWIQIGIGEDGFGAKWFDLIAGNKERIFVYYRSEDDDDCALLDPTQLEMVLVRNVPYMAWVQTDPTSVVDKSLAKRVLKHFFEHHERLIEGITWEGG